MRTDDFISPASVQKTAQLTDRNRSRSSLNRPIPYYVEPPDGWCWDHRIPYRLSVESGASFDDVGSMGMVP